jgi:tyrosine-protein kinase Etk/Wzc
MIPSVITHHHDPRQRLAGRSDSHVVLVDTEDAPRLSDYKDIFLDHRRLILGVIACLLGIGAIYATLATPVYRGNLLIQIEESQPDGKMFLNETSGLFEVKTPSAGEIQVLGSRLVLGAAVDQAGLRVAAEPNHLPVVGAWLSTMATGLSNPGFLGLGGYVTGTERIGVARFAVPAFLENTEPFVVTAGADGHYTVRHRLLDAPLDGKVGEPLQKQLPEGPIDIQISRLDGRPGAEFKVSAFSRFHAIEQLQSRLQLTELGRQSNVISVSVEDTDRQRLKRSLAAIGQQYVLQNMERKSAEAQKTLAFLDAQLPVFQRQLHIAEDALAKFRNQNGTASFDEETRVWLRKTSELQSSLLDLQQRRREAEVHFTDQSPRIATLDRQIRAVQGDLGALNARIASMPNVERDALRLEHDVKVNSDLYQSMQNNALQMRLVKEGRIGNVRLLDKADVAEVPVRPQKLLVMAFALLLGLFAGPGMAIARTRGRLGIRNPDEVEASTGLDVYAVLPHSPQQVLLDERAAKDPSHARLLADVYPHSEPIEALRSLRVALRMVLAQAPNNRILITGATPDVGKSFIASNFALLLAQSGRRVLLVNADLRRGDKGFNFGLGTSAGLSEVLSGQIKHTQAIQVNVRPNLDVLPTGKLPDFPADMLESDAFVRSLDTFSSGYDVVVLDTAPVLVAADAVTVALACGVVLLVARAEQDQLAELNESVRRLNQAGVPIDGLLFNGMNLDKRYNSRYYHRHRSYRSAAQQYALPNSANALSR